MKIVWQDLPRRQSCFTTRSAVMMDLDKKIIIQYYSANTKIVVVQKCVIPEGTFYRTETAKLKSLNWAFKASALGLPDEKAPSAHPNTLDSQYGKTRKPVSRTPRPVVKKQKVAQKATSPKDGEVRSRGSWLKRLFRRKNGKAKNS